MPVCLIKLVSIKINKRRKFYTKYYNACNITVDHIKITEKLNWTCVKSPCTMSAFVTFHCNFSFLVTHILLFIIFATEHAVEHSKVSIFLIKTIVKFISHFQKEIFGSKEYCILKNSIVNLKIYASHLATAQNVHCSYVQNTLH